MIIAFSVTTPAFIAGRKHRTRRTWKDAHAARVQRVIDAKGTLDAWDFSPRVGPMRVARGLSKPKKVGLLRPLSLVREDISTMQDGDFELEGFKYLQEQGLTIFGKEPWRAFLDWRSDGGEYWVLDFLPIVDGGPEHAQGHAGTAFRPPRPRNGSVPPDQI
ncbi:MAG: hypothetical protein KGI26_07090 [Thaumarchaeota archaeon]|nr:hypothetical protein [Nitrososphaerota archaeon]